MSGIEASYGELAASRGMEPLGSFDAGPLTPLLVESGGGRLAPAVRGRLGEGDPAGDGSGGAGEARAPGPVAGVAGQLAYTRNATFRFNVALAEVPAATAFAPRLFCIRRGRRTRDDEFYGFEARDSKLWTESTALNERFVISTSPFQEENWLRQLFSPAFIDYLASGTPAGFSFELAYGALLGSVEDDDPGAAGLAALCDATARVAARIARECGEAA